MVTIKLKETTIKNLEGKKLSISDLIKGAINSVGREGVNSEEMRKRQRVLDALEKGTDKMSLEDADYETLKECVDKMQWAMVHKDILAFVDDVNNAKKEN